MSQLLSSRLFFPLLTGFLLTLAASPLAAVEGTSVYQKHVRATLLADVRQAAPGSTFWLGIRYEMDPEWHIYWKNPGDTGLPTKIEWTLPPGWTAGELQWPTPISYELFGLMNFVYEESVILLAEISVPAGTPANQPVRLSARTEWLACADTCEPGAADLTLDLPLKPVEMPDFAVASQFSATRATWPKTSDQWEVTGSVSGDKVILLITGGRDAPLHRASRLYFFPEIPAIDVSVPQLAEETGPNQFRLVLTRASHFQGEITSLPGVLRSERNWDSRALFQGLQIDPFADSRAAAAADPAKSPAAPSGPNGPAAAPPPPPTEPVRALPGVLLAAFLGGLVLNLMPCVFPVLGIKILGFAQQSGGNPGKLRLHGLTFALGVLLSLWVLVALLLAIRTAGAGVGWGFQLQEPRFVAFLIGFFFLFGLNLAGLFEVGGSLMGVGSRLLAKEGLSGSFFSGVLAVLVATPCTGPFMAPAIGFALAQPGIVAFAVFSSLGLGLAAPYVLLAFLPVLINRLPRPGPWMETFKQFMAFPLFGTCIWLLWVFGQLTDLTAATGLLFVLLALALAAWVFGRWCAPHCPLLARRTGVSVVLLLFLAAILAVVDLTRALPLPEPSDSAAASSAPSPENKTEVAFGVTWHPWSPAEVARLLADGKTVYVDFTAAWCLTCQANKRLVFSSQEVRDRFNSDPSLVLLKADWTKRDPRITETLATFGRSGVPLNVIYSPHQPPVILPTTLSPGTVLAALP